MFSEGGCAYLGLQVKAINCISPCLYPVLIGFNQLPTVRTNSAWVVGEVVTCERREVVGNGLEIMYTYVCN
jgi:hypothetical protein